MISTSRIVCPALVVIAPLIAAAWLPPGFPHLLRQLLLSAWGVGATVGASRLFFTSTFEEAARAVGLARARRRTIVVACLASLPMWAFLPLVARAEGADVDLRPDWLAVLIGVALVNGITEEVIHRGFVFGQLRRGRTFLSAATLSAGIFAAQHLYIIAVSGWVIGLASVALAALLAYPLAFVYERGGASIAGPAILHTSSNAPVLVFALPEPMVRDALLPHMAVVLVALYLLFAPAVMPPRHAHGDTVEEFQRVGG